MENRLPSKRGNDKNIKEGFDDPEEELGVHRRFMRKPSYAKTAAERHRCAAKVQVTNADYVEAKGRGNLRTVLYVFELEGSDSVQEGLCENAKSGLVSKERPTGV